MQKKREEQNSSKKHKCLRTQTKHGKIVKISLLKEQICTLQKTNLQGRLGLKLHWKLHFIWWNSCHPNCSCASRRGCNMHTYTIVRKNKVFLKLFFAPLPFDYEIRMLVYTCSATCRLSRPDSLANGKSRRVENVENHRRDAAQQLNKCKQQDETERMGQIKTLHFHLRKTQMRHDISKCILLPRNA